MSAAVKARPLPAGSLVRIAGWWWRVVTTARDTEAGRAGVARIELVADRPAEAAS